MVIGLDANEANVERRVGSGVYALELLKELLKNNKHQFIVYLKDQPLADLPKESSNLKYKVFGPKKLWTQFALPISLTFSEKPDIFFSMGHYGPRFSKVPYVVTIHDLSYLHFPEMFNKNDLYQLTYWSKYSIQNSAHVMTVSKSTKEDIVRSYGVDPSKITVTYEGFDEKRFKPQTKTKTDLVREKYMIDGDYIIFVGTLQPRKNIERLIEAFKLLDIGNLHFRQKTLQLVICGKKGWLFDSVFQKVKDLKLEDKIIFTDFVPNEDLPALISGAEAYVLPSLWEGFGIPVIEAQACRVPVIVSDSSSLPEIVGESGILVDPTDIKSIGDGIRTALKDNIRTVLVKKGLENIKRFSWQKCAQETLIILEKVASKS